MKKTKTTSIKRDLDARKIRPLVDDLKDWLDTAGIETTICGSMRRGLLKVHDVDVVVQGPLDKVRLELKSFAQQDRSTLEIKTSASDKKMDFILDGIPFNAYWATKDEVGAMIMFLTGNRSFNILMRIRARDQGMKLNQYGLFHNDTLIAGKTEHQLFDALGVQYKQPKDRELRSRDNL